MRQLITYLLLLLGSIHLYSDESYQLGEGVHIGSLPLYLGGYFSIDYQHKEDFNRYRIDDLALLSYGNYKKLSYIVELEYKALYVHTDDNHNSTTEWNPTLHIERLYGDYALNDNFCLRIGKYNSPIGFWNLTPINVLRETTSNPITSSIIFPKFTTGIALNYQSFSSHTMQAELLIQHNTDLDDEYNNYKVDQHYGLSIGYEYEDIALKFNIGYFHINHTIEHNQRYYGLISAQIDKEQYQILSEVGTQADKNGLTTPYALYLQGLYRWSENHITILRLESYHDKIQDQKEQIAVVGYTYRPYYPIALKVEYQLHSHHENNQILLSLSVLF
jgi:hypothetical protein